MKKTSREHGEWTAKLSDYMADELDAGERAAVEAHLAACEACNAAHQDLVRIVTQAGALGDVQPPTDLWGGIASGIRAQEGRIPDVLPLPVRPGRGATGSTVELSPRRLAAAAVVLVALSGTLSWWAGSTRVGSTAAPAELGSGPVVGVAGGVPGAPTGLAEELATLEEVLAAARGVLDPNTVRVIESSLGVIEQAIADSREALLQDPGNAFLAEHLERMYRRKLVYLQDALRFAELES
jgi:anti-sigma factor RsiW